MIFMLLEHLLSLLLLPMLVAITRNQLVAGLALLRCVERYSSCREAYANTWKQYVWFTWLPQQPALWTTKRRVGCDPADHKTWGGACAETCIEVVSNVVNAWAPYGCSEPPLTGLLLPVSAEWHCQAETVAPSAVPSVVRPSTASAQTWSVRYKIGGTGPTLMAALKNTTKKGKIQDQVFTTLA
jgi:hypothetical protein